jgi:hypothetical protein
VFARRSSAQVYIQAESPQSTLLRHRIQHRAKAGSFNGSDKTEGIQAVTLVKHILSGKKRQEHYLTPAESSNEPGSRALEA